MHRVNETCLRIASAQGIPGAAGALVRDERGALGVLTNYHVALGGGASLGDRVWAVPPEGSGANAEIACLGFVRRGYMGRITLNDVHHYVDCAFVELGAQDSLPGWVHAVLASSQAWPGQIAKPALGSRVHKVAAITGQTTGVLASIDYDDHPIVGGHALVAPAQLLVRSSDPEKVFFAPGESGAALRDTTGAMIGLLWGTKSNGDGIACAIAPVLEWLQVTLAEEISGEWRRSA